MKPDIIHRYLPIQCYGQSRLYYQPKPLMPEGVVQHFFSGQYTFSKDPFDLEKCWRLMHDLNMQPEDRQFDLYPDDAPKVSASAHFMIGREGEIVQLVPLDFQAWHAGKSKWKGRSNCNDFMIGIENIGLLNFKYTEYQYKANAALCRWLMDEYGFSLDMITGHENVAPGRKKDPGPTFNWDLLHDLINGALDS